VYALVDSITFEVRYIGETADVGARLQDHLQVYWRVHDHPESARSARERWFATLPWPPTLRVLEECPVEELPKRERDWIFKLRAEGHDLVNQLSAGPTECD